MNKLLPLLMFMYLGPSAASGGLPEEVTITKDNASLQSISITKSDSGSTTNDLYQLSFPQKSEGCLAGRVQTALFAGSDEISSTSMDYQVGSSDPSILFHMPSAGYDMAVTVQYCCRIGSSTSCKRALSVLSIKELVQ